MLHYIKVIFYWNEENPVKEGRVGRVAATASRTMVPKADDVEITLPVASHFRTHF